MEDRETARMRKYGKSTRKTTRIMMATIPLVISGLGLRKFQADGFLLTRVYNDRILEFVSRLALQCLEYPNPGLGQIRPYVPPGDEESTQEGYLIH